LEQNHTPLPVHSRFVIVGLMPGDKAELRRVRLRPVTIARDVAAAHRSNAASHAKLYSTVLPGRSNPARAAITGTEGWFNSTKKRSNHRHVNRRASFDFGSYSRPQRRELLGAQLHLKVGNSIFSRNSTSPSRIQIIQKFGQQKRIGAARVESNKPESFASPWFERRKSPGSADLQP
jgi:hypothetical protein